MKDILAYTDGSAVSRGRNAGKGGFGVYFPDLEDKPTAFSIGFKDAKVGQMEVMALLYAIKAIDPNWRCKLIVYSDSEYVVKSFTENRLEKWVENGWKNSSGEVKNKKLWKEIRLNLKKRKKMKFEIHHIKSHQIEKEKDPSKIAKLVNDKHIMGNMVADSLADYKRHEDLI